MQQVETVKMLLKKGEYVEEVNLVRYTLKKRKPVYDEPIRLTPQNIGEFAY